MSKVLENKPETTALSSSSADVGCSHLQPDDPRRNLIFDILKVSEPFQVHLRVRPLTNQEKEKKEIEFTHAIEKNSLLVKTPLGLVHEFKFTKVFDRSADQNEIFGGTALSAVKDFIDGQNHIIFSYGVTNSGKTYTMQGNPAEPGVIPRALEMLFRTISHRLCSDLPLKPHNGSIVKVNSEEAIVEKRIKEEVLRMENDSEAMRSVLMESINASVLKNSILTETSNISDDSLERGASFRSTMDFIDEDFFCVFVSFIEIYNEKVYDLLAPIKGSIRPVLNLQENKSTNLFAKGVREICVNSVEEALQLLMIGQQNLKVASTKLNYSSSRSHSVYTIKVLRATNVLDPSTVKISQLCFCDLAGSERYTNTQNVGERLKEAGLINTSLLVLGRCISALRHNQLYPKEPSLPIPFRESKLTRILQGFFTGKGKALMIVNVSPCERVINETYHVLRFSAIAKEVVLPQNLECLTNLSKVTKLSLDFIRQSLSGKESIDWESPRTSRMKSSVLTDYYAESGSKSNATIDEEESANEETDHNETADFDQVQKYWGIIQTLRDKLIQEHKEKGEIEMQVRDEMGDYFLNMLSKNEDRYRDGIAEERDRMEEMADKRIQNTIDYYKGLVNEAKAEADEELDELKEKIVSLEEKLNSFEEEKYKVVSELNNKIQVLNQTNSEANVAIEKLQKEVLQLKTQLKHLSRETQSSLYFSMINTGSSSSSEDSNQEPVNATVYVSPRGDVKSSSDDVFFKSPLPKAPKIDPKNAEILSTSVSEDEDQVSAVLGSNSSSVDMSVDEDNTSESKHDASTEGETVSVTEDDEVGGKNEALKMCSTAQQTDLRIKDLSFSERQQNELAENNADLEEMILKFECTNGFLVADIADLKLTIDGLKEKVRELELRVEEFDEKSVLEVASQTDLTCESLAATDEQLSKAESGNKEYAHRMKLMKKREIELNKELDKAFKQLADYDEERKTYRTEKKALEDKLVAVTSKSKRLQLELDKAAKESARPSKSVINLNTTTVSESDLENSQPGPSGVKPKKLTKQLRNTVKNPIYVDDSDSSEECMSLRSRSKTGTKRTRELEVEEKKSSRHKKTCRVAKTNEMLICSPGKETKEVKPNVHKEVMRKLRTRK